MGHWVRGVEAQWRRAFKKAYPNKDLPPDRKGDGIILCVDFQDGFTQYLPEQQHRNPCCDIYGVEFCLVNYHEVNNRRTWDPWFDITDADPQPRLIEYLNHRERNLPDRSIQYIYDPTDEQEGDTPIFHEVPKTFCKNPSPGNAIWKGTAATGSFQREDGYTPLDRDPTTLENGMCTDPPDGLGVAIEKRNATTIEEIWADHFRRHTRDLRKRATGAFLDPKVYTFFGCSSQDLRDDEPLVEDPCSTPGADPDSCDTGGPNVGPPADHIIVGSPLPSDEPTGTAGPFPTTDVLPTATTRVNPNDCLQDQYLNPRPRYYPPDLTSAAAAMATKLNNAGLKPDDKLPIEVSLRSVILQYGWARDQSGCYPKTEADGVGDDISKALVAIGDSCKFLSPFAGPLSPPTEPDGDH